MEGILLLAQIFLLLVETFQGLVLINAGFGS